MDNDIKVSVVEFGDRKHYLMQYRCPVTGKRISKSTKVERTGRKRERDAAERAAGDWEKQLRDGTYQPPSKTTWEHFRERYETEKLPALAPATGDKVSCIFNGIEKTVNPSRMLDLTTGRISHYQAELRKRGLSENTIKTHLAHLRAALAWAVDVGMLAVMPKISMPQRARGSKVMKGRPITLEEFERILDKAEAVVGQSAAPSWRFYLRGLWASGLRLSESMELYWDRDDKLRVDLSGKRPMLWIPAALEKGNKDRRLPMAPEFAELLLTVPADQRRGPVFNPRANRVKGPRLLVHRVGELVSTIGKAAGVKVNTDQRTGKVKFASAHDLRRSFGERWSTRVMPQVLQELMRHERIETTLAYYVGQNAERTADVLWAAHKQNSNSSSNNAPTTAEAASGNSGASH